MSTDTGSAGVKRRDFLKVLGAAGATGATIGCSSEKVEKLIPYLVQPDNTVPGVSNYYATVVHDCVAGCGVIAEVRDGRAIKLEGNPAHPLNQGAICARCQASLQGLYNPDRYRGPMMRQGNGLVPTTWEAALQTLQQRLGGLGANAANAVFINQAESGSFPALLDQWLAANGMPAHVAYDADAPLGAIEANRQTYGVAWPSIDFTQARLVVSVGADFLDGWGPSVPLQLSWADARAQMQDAPRMVYIGARRSLTGLNADEWIAARPGSELALVNALRDAAGGNAGGLAAAAEAAGVEVAQLQRLAAEMASARPAVVLAGTTGADATQVALAANAINATTGAVGTVLRPDRAVTSMVGSSSIAQLRGIVQRMAAGQVPVVFVRGANPAFTTPTALGFAAAMARVPFKVSFSSYPDETSALCDLILPDHHALESWGDTQPLAGSVAFQQPTMNPVFNTRQTADVLIALGRGNAAAAGNFPQPTYREWLAARNGGAMAFAGSLASGIASGTTLARTAPPAAPAATPAQAAPAIGATEGNFFLVVYPSPLLGTGAGANKPWLQELADPVTKIAWQSWVELHPITAREMNVRAGDHVTVRTATGSLTAPAYPYLGIRRDTVAVALGRGHTEYGRYARGIGVNPLAIVPAVDDAQSGALALTVTRAQVTAAGDQSDLVTTEGSARQHGRGIAQAVAAAELGAPAAAVQRAGENATSAGTTPPQGVESGSGQIGDPGAGGEPQTTQQGEHSGTGRESVGAAGAGAAGAAAAEGAHGGGHDIPGLASHEFLPGLRSPVAGEAQGNFIDSTSKDLGMYDPDHWSRMARRRWAMTIDLARCTGCSACVVACYAENNIPTVGAPYQGRALSPFTWDERPGANIVKGREMTWIRLERYFEGGEDGSSDFETRFVPMLCQHCGNAPCEPVCPVYATYHSPDGLNVQVYNRCVGTRYCSNNCPYKVRYFNWFGYGEPERRQYAWPEPLNWQLNPDVTVRGKGVMEKCTFCVQRIREAEHRARLEGREVQADEFTTACAQACPSRAITFGDAADATWSVAQLAVDRRAYHVFEELNTYTAVVYLKKVLHPAPAPATA